MSSNHLWPLVTLHILNCTYLKYFKIFKKQKQNNQCVFLIERAISAVTARQLIYKFFIRKQTVVNTVTTSIGSRSRTALVCLTPAIYQLHALGQAVSPHCLTFLISTMGVTVTPSSESCY